MMNEARKLFDGANLSKACSRKAGWEGNNMTVEYGGHYNDDEEPKQRERKK